MRHKQYYIGFISNIAQFYTEAHSSPLSKNPVPLELMPLCNSSPQQGVIWGILEDRKQAISNLNFMIL